MRKSISILFMLAFATVSTFANPIDQQKAKSIAQQLLVPGHSMTLVSKAQRSPLKASRLTTTLAATSPYYVFSRGQGQGYVVVAGDDCLPEILGYTDSGDFDADNLPPALTDMLCAFANIIEDAQVSGTNLTMSKAPARAASSRTNISPLTTSHWHQSSPYNDICPSRIDNGARAMTGCVATAASQILYYWRRDLPNTLGATTPTYTYGGAHPQVSFPKGSPVKWDLMCDTYSNEPAEYKQAVAEFVYQVGTATWLTYADGEGTSTSGNIEKIPATFSNYFGMNGGNVHYRNSYNQEGWTQLIYDELAKGRPVMYTGLSSASGGHAVFINGYKTSGDLFYFNFGWGGTGDGYWTTTLEDGMNGFNEYQSALIGAFPKKWNMNTKISQPPHVYANQDNTFTITVENNSTLDFNGIYLFSASTTSKPTDLSKAQSQNTDVVIERGQKGVLTLTAKPTSVKTWYITATDANLNVLEQISVETEAAEVSLQAENVTTFASSQTKQVSKHNYNMVYSGKVMIEATVSNNNDLAFGGTAKLDIYVSEDNGETFSLLKTLSKANVQIAPHSQGSVTFSFTGMDANKLYYAAIQPQWGAYNMPTIVDVEKNNPQAFFCSEGASNLKYTLNDGVLTFTGNWDAAYYQTAVEIVTNKKAVEYDLTQVNFIGRVPMTQYPSPNALIYVNKESAATGDNVIAYYDNEEYGIVTGDLNLTVGYDYTPRGKEMRASNLPKLHINQEPNQWYLLTAPFDCTVPDGIIAREIISHKQTSTGINNATANVNVLVGGKTYLVMTSSTERQTLAFHCGEDTEPQTKTFSCFVMPNVDTAVKGTFTTTAVPTGAKTIKYKEADKQYFMTAEDGEVCEAMRGYFFDENMPSSTTDFRAYSNMTLDPAYLTLGQHIQMLYDVKNMYSGIVSAAANTAMNDSIASAEKLFSEQYITSTSTLKKRYQALADWIEIYKTLVGAVGNIEVDMTSLIVNPSFEESTITAKGWTSDVANDTKVRLNSNLTYKTIYGDGDNFLYNATGSRVSQTISGLKAGNYRLSAMLGCEGDTKVTLSAGSRDTTVAAHSFGKHYLTKAEIDGLEIGQDGQLTIAVSADGWYNADDFTLTYTGGDEEYTAIEDIANEAVTTTINGIYTLQGIKVNDATAPGIYVINGRKVVKSSR